MKNLSKTIGYSLIIIIILFFIMVFLGGVYCSVVQSNTNANTGVCAEGLLPWIFRNIK